MLAESRRCPICRLPVARESATLVEGGEVIHLGCDLGLLDAGAAVARLLRERPGQPLCVACIASALGLTLEEARTGSARLRPLRGFDVGFAPCLGCRARRQVFRAVRAAGRAPGEASRPAL